jgi:hypothetical protein
MGTVIKKCISHPYFNRLLIEFKYGMQPKVRIYAPGTIHHTIYRGTKVGKFLTLTQSAMNRAVRRGEKLVEEMNLTLVE